MRSMIGRAGVSCEFDLTLDRFSPLIARLVTDIDAKRAEPYYHGLLMSAFDRVQKPF